MVTERRHTTDVLCDRQVIFCLLDIVVQCNGPHINFHCRMSYVSRAFSALRVYLTFRHHHHPLSYLFEKFRFFRGLHCWASPWGKIAYSVTHHPAYLIPREPKHVAVFIISCCNTVGKLFNNIALSASMGACPRLLRIGPNIHDPSAGRLRRLAPKVKSPPPGSPLDPLLWQSSSGELWSWQTNLTR